MENRIKKVMSEVLGIKIDLIDDNTSPETIEAWDSLKQMNLVVALEEEFGTEFDDEEMSIMLNYKLIETIIKDKVSE